VTAHHPRVSIWDDGKDLEQTMVMVTNSVNVINARELYSKHGQNDILNLKFR
jgi:hypothetical protein